MAGWRSSSLVFSFACIIVWPCYVYSRTIWLWWPYDSNHVSSARGCYGRRYCRLRSICVHQNVLFCSEQEFRKSFRCIWVNILLLLEPTQSNVCSIYKANITPNEIKCFPITLRRTHADKYISGCVRRQTKNSDSSMPSTLVSAPTQQIGDWTTKYKPLCAHVLPVDGIA